MDGYTAINEIVNLSAESHRRYWRMMGYYLFSAGTKGDPVAAFQRDQKEFQEHRRLFPA